ncbi:hypothetical protein PoB_001403300 [Plakobranchus ocellatus]|uniref:Uncharacterized protein n=1 Tax=Plakobranchus ocellatus TaxID=259542 RepID=A0AAV3YYE1_9GAST|nr:hypothetical protein PoB_001403300 [Plakobranchus ocellatus]
MSRVGIQSLQQIVYTTTNIALQMVDKNKHQIPHTCTSSNAEAEAEAVAGAWDSVSRYFVSVGGVAVHASKEDALREERHAEGAKPYSVPVARIVPSSLQEKVREELDHMEKAGIIQPVTEPTD